MLQGKFSSFIEKKDLVSPGQKVLLAVSGGVDSVVMAYLFYKTGLNFAIAHCNFKLRGDEADKDETFVKDLAEKLSVPFHNETFNTLEEYEKSSDSIQMIARTLRYEWLEEVREEQGYDLKATAHHHDDNIETLLINLLRGTGIHGLKGIPLKNKNVIRPLLFATREEIEKFAEKHNLSYREDHTNKENKYLRNILRNKVIPVFKDINPDFRYNFKQFFENIELPYQCYINYIEKKKEELLIKEKDRYFIPLQKLKQQQHINTILFELLKNYGFNANTIEDIVASIDKQPGKMFYGKGYVLVKDREYFILFPGEAKTHNVYFITDQPANYDFHDVKIKTQIFHESKGITFSKSECDAYLDFDKLQFPLKLRPWVKGDVFQPLGMGGKKKVSDFLIDKKVSVDQKNKVYVLCSGEEIVWVVGYRIDERFKIDAGSKRCFYINSEYS